MGRANTRALHFAKQVRAEMKTQNLGVRTLARKMSENGQTESTRRSLNKWLSGNHYPSSVNRQAVADALGVTRESLEPDEDEESPAMSALQVALMEAVREAVSVQARELV